jgi:hypothetical protein
MAFLKSVKLIANRSIGRSITKGHIYIGYKIGNKYSVETNFGSTKDYSEKLFDLKEK